MNKVIIVTLLLILASCNDVKKSDACACDKLKSEPDCKAVSTCAWTAAVAPATGGTCAKPTTPTTMIIKSYCELVDTPATACWKTVGCAYVDAKCTHFTGCTAYVKTTDADCQAISKSCTSDGVTCIATKSCTEYTTLALCGNASNSGTGKCKWDTTGAGSCRNYTCSEGDATHTTDALCNTYLAGCVTNGKGCVTSPKPACATYLGDATTCAGYKGSDGNCEGVTGGTNCRARVCTGAPATNTTNALCAEYQTGCITSGKGCVASPLPACSTYAGDVTTCVGYNGSDGICEGDAAGTACRGRNCTNAPSSSNTDALCVAYKTGCVTTGKGCVATRGACSGYTGTSTTCVGYQGSDGYCKGTSSTTVGACSPMVCTEAAATLNTDAACAAYQIGCRTTGKGCIATLGACSSYNGTATSCDGYVGTDGKCKGSGTTSAPCAPKVCSEAPITLASNTECSNYQTGCVTNGTGCVAITSCPNSVKQLSCTGTTGCGWQNSCLAITLCSDFITQGTCLNNLSGLTATTKKPCYWTGSACRDLACTDAATTFNTDSQCNTHLAGCVTNARGCVALTAPCSNYQGTQTTCANFTKRCWNDAAAVATTTCLDRTCAHDITSTTDGACISFLSTCLTKGTGCIERTALCTAYLGTQATCNGFKGNNQVDFCYNIAGATAATPCTVKVCTDNTTASSDGDCGTFLTGCLWNGATGCVAKTASCSSYTGTTTTCANYKGVNGTIPCWTTSATATGCVDKACSHAAITLITDTACKDFLSSCLTNGAGCVSNTAACSTYTGDANVCSNFTGNSKKCLKKDSCRDRACGDITTAANQAACDAYLSGACQLIGTTCTTKVACASFTALASQCQTLTGTDGACWSTVGQSTSVAAACTLKTCALATTPASQTDCTNWKSGCRYSAPTTGKVCVESSINCSGLQGVATECQGMTGGDGACWSSTGASTTTAAACVLKDCTLITAPTNQAACTNFLTGCRFSAPTAANVCVASTTNCSGLQGTAPQCQAMSGNDGACWSSSGASTTVAAACTLKVCSLASAPADVATCTNFTTTGCRFSKPATGGNVCLDWKTTCAILIGLPADCQAWTGMDGPCWSQPSASTTVVMPCVLKACNLVATAPTGQASCDAFATGCRFDGAATGSCLQSTVTNCSQLTGTDVTCKTYTGNDGPCWSTSSTAAACVLRTCAHKLATATSQADCTTHLAGCVYTAAGTTCVNKTTKCAGLTLTSTLCQATVAADGPCWSVEGASSTVAAACVLKICSLTLAPTAPASCSGFLTGCLFTKTSAIGFCKNPGTNCTSLWGTASECQAMTGADTKPCWSAVGASTTVGAACIVIPCANIPTPANQVFCQLVGGQTCNLTRISAGVTGCLVQGNCSTYSGTGAECQSYTGLDGKCSGATYGATHGSCIVISTCTTFVPATANDAGCEAFKSGCKFSKIIDANTNSCIPQGNCSTYFGTAAICQGYTGSDGKCGKPTNATTFGACIVIGTDCYKLVPVPGDDATCNALIAGCKFFRITDINADSCIPIGSCSTYRGTAAICQGYTATDGQCGKTSNATTFGSCTVIGTDCTKVFPATGDDAACNKLIAGCKFSKITDASTNSCIPQGNCSTYFGTAAICQGYTGSDGKCGKTTNATTFGACTVIGTDCTSILLAGTGDDATCNAFIAGCKFSKITDASTNSCIPQGNCSTYFGTAAICQGYTGSDGKCGKTTNATTFGACTVIGTDCTSILLAGTGDDATCNAFIAGCKFSKKTDANTNSCIPQGNCSTYFGTAAICQGYTGSDGKCGKPTNATTFGACIVIGTDCNKVVPAQANDLACDSVLSGCKLTRPTNSTTGCIAQGACSTYQGITSECKGYTGSDGKCTGYATHGACYAYKACSAYSDTTANCKLFVGTDGQCWSADGVTGTANCVLKTCGLKTAPTQLSDCGNFITGCLFSKPTVGNICVPASTLCSGHYGLPADCQGFVAADGKCWSAPGASTTVAAACILRTCAHKTTPAPASLSDCTTHLNTCLFSQPTAANVCVPDTTKCSGLQGTPAQCQTFTGYDGPCYSAYGAPAAVQACVLKTCELRANPTSQADCNGFIPGCRFSRETSFCTHPDTTCTGLMGAAADCQAWTGKDGVCWSAAGAVAATIQACVLKSSLACSAFTGDGAYCNALTQSDGKCWWSGANATTSAACRARACTDDVVSITDALCAAHLTGCKTKGVGCVASSTVCSSLTGTSATCPLFTSSTGTNKCKFGTSVSGACQDKSCYDDVTSATNQQCEAYFSGCLTKGAGCVPNTAPCSEYSGVQATCGAFVGSSGTKKCWNSASATATITCAEKQCIDDVASTTDAACAAFLTGCITKGVGCVPTTSACSTFSGTTATCGNFKGNSGTKLCWNISTATATTACVEKMCSHNTTSITDADCAAFLPQTPATANPLCVTNGTGCVDYPRACSAFTGTTEACGKFRASDGPCKSSVLTGSGACTPRICTEALNNLNTDVLCKAWHPSCVTNGYGCVTSVACSSVTEMTSCNAKTGCGWLSSCQTIGTSCSSLTALGQSICANTPVITGTKACGWFNSVCRDLTCDDLSANLTTDTACAAIISTCTTKGAGCITKGLCSTYSSKSICEAAKTTNTGDTCIWDTTNVCRAKRCTDAPTESVTNTACDAYLTTCKTNGITCIDTTSNCNAIRTQVACLKDGMNNPCLWVNGICYNYAKCEDVTSTTHAACQRYSPQCTTNGVICVAINKCEKTTLAVSCEIGTDGECGWLPAAGANAAKCQKFGACTDAIGTTLAACAAYDPTCITDGTKCVAKTTCGGYGTQVACETNGSDGTCQWTASGTTGSCRLRECSDATALNATAINSYSGCYSFSAKTKCSTDGAKCIPLAACQAYTVEAGCVLGTDGTCTFDLAVGATTGNKSCRVKVCSDFKLLTSVACSTALTGAGAGTGCVSNGTNCIAKAACSTYTAREACNGGGSDGICAFTAGAATTPNVGTCKLMTACTDANNDQFACSLKAASCKFTSTTTGTTTTTTCAAQTCATVATGTTCNPVPSFDGVTYSICLLTNNVCVTGDGASLSSTTCFSSSLGTYSWNTATSKCEACFISTILNEPGTNNTETDGGSSLSSIMQALFTIVGLMAVFA